MAKFVRANPYLQESIDFLDEHLEKYRGDIARATEYLPKSDSDWIDQEFAHVLREPRYFLSNYYAIKTEDEGFKSLYPFWDSQEILHDEFRRQQREEGRVKAMINKARQQGATAYVGGEIFYYTVFTEHINTIIVAQDADQARFILDMYSDGLDFLPWWMRPRVRYKQAGAFVEFDEKDDTLRDTRPGLKTRIYVDNGNKPTGAGRGKNFKTGHLSEVSFYSDPTQLTKSLFPTMKAADGFYVMESTPQGRNNFWHNLWKQAERGVIDWNPIYIPFYRRERSYSIPIRDGEKFELTKEEQELREQIKKRDNFFIKDEVLKWRRMKIQEFIANDGDDKMFSQEYSTNAEESFQTSATTAYPIVIINRLLRRAIEPVWVGEIDYDFEKGRPAWTRREVKKNERVPSPERYERFHVWEEPIHGESYCIGVDVSLGNEGGDYSCIQVIKLASGHQKDEQVACWHGLIDPESLAVPIFAIANMYNMALVAVEVNNMGMSTNNELVRRFEYENIYRFKRLDRLKNPVTDIIGWWSDDKSTRAMMAKMSKVLIEDVLIVSDRHTIDEFYDYTEDEGAKGKAHDDYVDALHIALYCGHEGVWDEIRKNTTAARPDANVFRVKDRFGTIVATTTSQFEAERIAVKHLGTVIDRENNNAAMVQIAGEKRKVPADFQSTDYSPIHDGQGSAHRMYYEENMEAEEIDAAAVAEYEAEMDEAQTGADGWLYQ